MRQRVDLHNPLESDIVLIIMEYLNAEGNHSSYLNYLYDCGELGLLSIHWGRHGWEYDWLKIDTPPETLRRLLLEIKESNESSKISSKESMC